MMTDPDFVNQGPKQTIVPRRNLDSALAAKEKLDKKKKQIKDKAARLLMTVILIMAVLFIVAAVGSYRLYQEIQSGAIYDQRRTDERPCAIIVNDEFIEGRRFYTYRYKEFMGIRFMQPGKTVERTELYPSGSATVVVGHLADGTHWTLSDEGGNRGIMRLPAADTYTVFRGGNVNSMSYTGFCEYVVKKSHPFETE